MLYLGRSLPRLKSLPESSRDRSTGILRVAVGKARVVESSNQIPASRIGGYMMVLMTCIFDEILFTLSRFI